MGTASVECTWGCRCEITFFDALWDRPLSIVQTHRFEVTQVRASSGRWAASAGAGACKAVGVVGGWGRLSHSCVHPQHPALAPPRPAQHRNCQFRVKLEGRPDDKEGTRIKLTSLAVTSTPVILGDTQASEGMQD